MPWQRHAADIGLEYEIDDDGLLVPAYREVIVTVMRQSGKSTLLFSVFGHRCALWPRQPQRVIYTAQDGSAARKKLVEDAAPLFQGSPSFSRLVERVYRGVGYEGITFRTGSSIRIVGSSESAGHGLTDVALTGIDESFADVDFRREQALQPMQATVRDAQSWNVSTAGTDASVFLRRKIEMGRMAAEAGRTSGIAYVEYSVPDGEDCDDPETWWRYMPALGWTITPEVVAHARGSMPDGEWRRSYGNQWTRSDERIIPAAVWDAACSESAAPSGGLVFVPEIEPERSSATIVAGGNGVVEVVDMRPGVAWLAARLCELVERHGGLVRLDAGGPVGAIASDLEAAGLRVERLGGREVVQACGRFYDALADGRVKVRRGRFADAVDQSVAAVGRRQVGDAWVWSRRSVEVDVSPVMAMTLAALPVEVSSPVALFAAVT